MKLGFRVPILDVMITVSDCIEDVFLDPQEQELARKSYGQTGWFDERGIMIYIEPNCPCDVLVHECVHAAGLILKMRGISYSCPPDDEILAYLVGYIHTEITELMNKHPRIIRGIQN